MSATWRSLLRDERGFVITAELVLISSVLVLGLVAALSAVKTAVAGELGDVAGAIGSLNQSYYTRGLSGCRTPNGVARSMTYGSAFLDRSDSTEEQQADFATVTAGWTTPPAMPAVDSSCVNPSVIGCAAPIVAAPCGPAPCGAEPCGVTPCASAPCGQSPCATSGCITIPPVVCPPGPAPFRGTDPFAPGAVSPKNMLLQGISYGGVCAAPPAGEPCCESTVVPALPSPVY